MNYKDKDELVCVKSKSCAYSEGKVYVVNRHPQTKKLCLIGNDGFYDPLDKLVSSFKLKDDKNDKRSTHLRIASSKDVD